MRLCGRSAGSRETRNRRFHLAFAHALVPVNRNQRCRAAPRNLEPVHWNPRLPQAPDVPMAPLHRLRCVPSPREPQALVILPYAPTTSVGQPTSAESPRTAKSRTALPSAVSSSVTMPIRQAVASTQRIIPWRSFGPTGSFRLQMPGTGRWRH